jgi:hypothetical protein
MQQNLLQKLELTEQRLLPMLTKRLPEKFLKQLNLRVLPNKNSRLDLLARESTIK